MSTLFQPETILSGKKNAGLKTIHGTVYDASTKDILHGASVHIWNTVSRTKVDSDGKFIIEVPTYLQSDVIIMEVKLSKYDSKILSFKIQDVADFLSIGLDHKGRSVKSSKRSLWKFFS